jgi:hypothetical protein
VEVEATALDEMVRVVQALRTPASVPRSVDVPSPNVVPSAGRAALAGA